jgi:hypothetical protein
MSLDPRRGQGRPVSPQTYYLLSNAWGLGIGALALVASVLYLVLPHKLLGDPVVASQLGGWAGVYYLGYGLSGALILTGIVGRRPSWDAAGLSLLAAAVAISLVALFSVVGAKALVSAPSTMALMFGSLGRLCVVARLVRPEPPHRLTVEDFYRTHGR